MRIRASGAGRVEGWVVSSSPNLVALRTDGSRIEVPALAVDSLWVRGNHSGTGAVIGVVMGLVVGAVATNPQCNASERCPVPLVLLAGAALGIPIGVLLGAAVPRWERRVPCVSAIGEPSAPRRGLAPQDSSTSLSRRSASEASMMTGHSVGGKCSTATEPLALIRSRPISTRSLTVPSGPAMR